MKVIVTMTKKEKNRILDQILFDPCERVECSGVDCANCPLRKAAVELRDAMNSFSEALDQIPEEGE